MVQKIGLCKGRHEIEEVKEYIFPQEVNPLDVKGLEETALEIVSKIEADELHIYVTGLTVALIASLNACKKLNKKVVLYHFDRTSGEYYPQEVL